MHTFHEISSNPLSHGQSYFAVMMCAPLQKHVGETQTCVIQVGAVKLTTDDIYSCRLCVDKHHILNVHNQMYGCGKPYIWFCMVVKKNVLFCLLKKKSCALFLFPAAFLVE